jgi:hypothetical protein
MVVVPNLSIRCYVATSNSIPISFPHTATLTCCHEKPPHFTNQKLLSQHYKCGGTEVHDPFLHLHKIKVRTAESHAVCCKGLNNLAWRRTAPYKPSLQLPRVPGLDSGSHGVTQLNVLTCCSHAMPWERRETSTSTLLNNHSYINKVMKKLKKQKIQFTHIFLTHAFVSS